MQATAWTPKAVVDEQFILDHINRLVDEGVLDDAEATFTELAEGRLPDDTEDAAELVTRLRSQFAG